MTPETHDKRTVDLLREYENAFSDGCFIQVSLALTGQMPFDDALEMVESALATPAHIESLGDGAERNLERSKALLERLEGSQVQQISLRSSANDSDTEAVELVVYDIDETPLDAIVENRMSIPVDESEKYHGDFSVEMVRSANSYMAEKYFLNGWRTEETE